MAEEENNEEKGQSEEKKGSKLVLIIIISLLVVILVVGGIVAYMLLSGDDKPPRPQQASSQQQQQNAPAPSELQVGAMFPLEPFTVNLLSESGRRYLKVKLNLEMSNPNLQAELNKKMPVVRDSVIGVLSSKTVEEISTRRGKENLKDEIIEQINKRLQDGYVSRVYFMMFVIQ